MTISAAEASTAAADSAAEDVYRNDGGWLRMRKEWDGWSEAGIEKATEGEATEERGVAPITGAPRGGS